MTSRIRLLLGTAALLSAVAPAVLSAEAPAVDFDRDIRPILAENCFACHGPDAGQRKAGLDLDTARGATARLKSGRAAVVPGKPAESELIRRVTAQNALRMPPESTGKHLTKRQVELLRRWIAAGARYSLHWAFVRPVMPPLPAVRNAGWAVNEIDRFVLARLEREGLKPSPPADRYTLLRRLSLDLTGLPPTPEETDAFVKDTRPGAYERQVDRLLASPRFGERMALPWLDLARYADTHGYHIDSHRDMWRWRDWVIDAFNRDLPYDRFVVEQLAGDLLPNATLEQKIASGFNRNHPINYEGGAIPEEYHAAYIFDRIDTTSTAFMGLTMRCAQCHDHKYEPLTTRDFYGLYALFNQVPEQGLDGQRGNAVPYLRAPLPEQEASLREMDARIAALDAARQARAREATADPEWQHRAADFFRRLAPAEAAGLIRLGPLRRILATEPPQRAPEHRQALADFYLNAVDESYRSLSAELAGWKKKRARLEAAIPTTMVMAELEKPRDTFMLIRGQYDRKGERVEPAVPAVLPPLPEGAPRNRLGLARWLVSPAHPLTARVAVNYLWQQFFGTGLVRTSENFGTQGERPSHPELLDYLAICFSRPEAARGDTGSAERGAGATAETKAGPAGTAGLGWSVKKLVRRIVTSATYRQSSRLTPELRERDPENRLLARGPRFRLPAEFIRDQALWASGLLVEKLGGPSVRPYQPPGLWEEISFGGDFTAQTYEQDHGEALYRRSMYTFWKRTCPPPALQTFDAPEREFCIVRRSTSNTPLQALVLLNETAFVEASRRFAERILTEGPRSTRDRLVRAFRTVLARPPREAELQVLFSILNHQLRRFRERPEDAAKLLTVGESPRNERLDSAEVAAWSVVANTILNLDEAISKN